MKIHIIEPLALDKENQELIRQNLKGHEVVYYPERNTETEETIRRARGAEIVVIANQPFPAEAVNALPEMKLLCVAFTGLDHVAMDACRNRGVTVCNAAGYSTVSVAELSIGLMIDLLRHITKLDPVTRSGGTREGRIGFDLSGKTVGIIGLGAIGERVARILQAFGCRLLAPDRGKSAPEGLEIELKDMDSLLATSDIITLHCPLNDSTRGLIGRRELELMKDSALLINCARGPVVDDRALLEALKNGGIAGAGLDVFALEPPLDSKAIPVLKLDNVVVTPHIAFATREAFIRRAEIVVDNILSWTAGNPGNVKN